jgi:hypothetical protein
VIDHDPSQFRIGSAFKRGIAEGIRNGAPRGIRYALDEGWAGIRTWGTSRRR